MDKKKSQKENKKTIWTMLIITITLAIIVIILYIPKQFGYLNLSCDELLKENILIIDSANYCLNDDDCMITTEVVMHICGCYELINKNTDLDEIKKRGSKINELYVKKICPIADCFMCNVPSKESIKCINKKCVVTE